MSKELNPEVQAARAMLLSTPEWMPVTWTDPKTGTRVELLLEPPSLEIAEEAGRQQMRQQVRTQGWLARQAEAAANKQPFKEAPPAGEGAEYLLDLIVGNTYLASNRQRVFTPADKAALRVGAAAAGSLYRVLSDRFTAMMRPPSDESVEQAKDFSEATQKSSS